MSLYKQFKTDSKIESQGVILDYGLNSKGDHIRIKVARAGGSNIRFAKTMAAKVKPYRRQIQNDTLDVSVMQDILKEVYAEAVVIGWEGVEDEDGKSMAYSPAAAVKLFTDLPDLFADIQEQAQQVALYRKVEREADAKN